VRCGTRAGVFGPQQITTYPRADRGLSLERAQSLRISVRGQRCPSMSQHSAPYEPVAWWFTRRSLGRDLREQYQLPTEVAVQFARGDQAVGRRLSNYSANFSAVTVGTQNASGRDMAIGARYQQEAAKLDNENPPRIRARPAKFSTAGPLSGLDERQRSATAPFPELQRPARVRERR
jgi:hypothetical protein